jgi:hypothetical protein
MRSRHLFLPLVALSLSLATPGQRLSAQNARYVLTSVEQNYRGRMSYSSPIVPVFS